MKIKAAIATAPGKPLSIEEVEITEEIGPHEVLVKNVACGICRSDMSVRDIPPGYAPTGFEWLPKPIVLGHEGAGVVYKVGSGVTDLAPGDHVIMSYHYCGTCPRCKKGLEPYCEDFIPLNLTGKRVDGSFALQSEKYPKLYAGHHQQSSFATYSIATDHNTVKVPKDLPLEMLGPLGCGFLTGAGAVLHRLKPVPDSSFAVFGSGPVGFAGLYMAKKLGATTRIAIDLVDSRIEMAKEFGATHTINASKVNDSVEALKEICPEGVDYVFEATASEKVMSQATEATAPLGTCIFSGFVSNPEAKFEGPALDILLGRTIGGTTMGHADMRGTIAQLIEGIQAGDFPIEKLVTYYDFEDINQAMEDSVKGLSIKGIVKMVHE